MPINQGAGLSTGKGTPRGWAPRRARGTFPSCLAPSPGRQAGARAVTGTDAEPKRLRRTRLQKHLGGGEATSARQRDPARAAGHHEVEKLKLQVASAQAFSGAPTLDLHGKLRQVRTGRCGLSEPRLTPASMSEDSGWTYPRGGSVPDGRVFPDASIRKSLRTARVHLPGGMPLARGRLAPQNRGERHQRAPSASGPPPGASSSKDGGLGHVSRRASVGAFLSRALLGALVGKACVCVCSVMSDSRRPSGL